MTGVLRYESAASAVRNAYYKAAVTSAALFGSSASLYYGGKAMAQHLARIAKTSPELIGTADAMLAITMAFGGYILGGMTLIGTPIAFFNIRAKSHVVTTVDKPNNKIYQSRKVPFQPDDAVEYNMITSVGVNQGPLEKRANTGSVVINTLRLVPDQDEGTRTEEDEITIPYQENPQKIRDQIAEGLPTHQDLVQRLRSI